MRYLLDTNVCIEISQGRNLALKTRLATKSLNELVLCSIVWAELHCGARLAQNPSQELAKLQDAFGHWPRLPFDDLAAESYGEIRSIRQTNLLHGKFCHIHDDYCGRNRIAVAEQSAMLVEGLMPPTGRE